MGYKSIIFLTLSSLLTLSFAFAGDDTEKTSGTTSEFSAIQEYNFDFKAVADGGKMNLSWNAFPEGKDFKWYKLAYSATKENPSYPEDASHFIGDKREQTTGEFWSKEKMLSVRLCAITHSNERFCSGSRKVTLNQETPKTPVKVETPIMCTMEYNPVCGKKDGVQMTYGNKCTLNAEKATYISMGECETKKVETPKTETPAVCTKEYAPVCGKKDGAQKTYGNKCMMNADKASYVSMGECGTVKAEIPKNTDTKMYKGGTQTCQLIKFACDEGTQYFSDTKGCGCEKVKSQTPSSVLPEALRVKMEKTIENFIVKLEAKGYSNEKNIATLEEVSAKLEKLAKQPKYKNLALYAIELIENAKVKYQDDFSEFEEIFSDF